jgi:hypothetical protein
MPVVDGTRMRGTRYLTSRIIADPCRLFPSRPGYGKPVGSFEGNISANHCTLKGQACWKCSTTEFTYARMISVYFWDTNSARYQIHGPTLNISRVVVARTPAVGNVSVKRPRHISCDITHQILLGLLHVLPNYCRRCDPPFNVWRV